jgi:exonuclease SbcC
MIPSITIKLFESHIDTNIKFHPGVNLLFGESDEGKSSLVRAIKWNAHNRPQGDSYRNDKLDPKDKRDKAKLTEVKVNYEGCEIARVRDGSGGINNYQINGGEPLKALRSDVPDEVQEITRFKNVNIQTQHPLDQYFLIGDKPGQISKEFNKVSGLVQMDKATADINSQVRSCNSSIKSLEKDIGELEDEIENTEWVDVAEKMAIKLKALKTKINKKESKLSELNSIIHELDKINKRIQKFNGLDDMKKSLKILEKQSHKITSEMNLSEQINNTILMLIDIDLQLDATVDICDAANALKQLNSDKKKIRIQDEKIQSAKKLIGQLNSIIKEINEAETEYNDALKKLDKIRTEQECPVCGRKGEN